MLLQFSVKNFLSFKERQDFTMEANESNDKLNNIVTMKQNNERILKTAALYGANASGKTNLLKALGAAIIMIKTSNTKQPGDKLDLMTPFAFDAETKNKPCEFEFMFYANGNKYVYGFKADENKIHEEYLYTYLSDEPTLIFERIGEDYSFLECDKEQLNGIKQQNLENKLFLATATTWNYDKTRAPFLWFSNTINVLASGLEFTANSVAPYDKDDDKSLKKFTLKLLEISDILIKDFDVEIEEQKISTPLFLSNHPMPISTAKTIKSILMSHEVVNDNGETNTFCLDIFEESSGTQILFSIAPLLKDVLENGKILCVDELNNSLHSNLVDIIIQAFHDPDLNIGNGQLIFNTHDTNLLSLDLFRRDQIWFAEKDPKKGSSELYPLDDFSENAQEDIEKGYLNGRFGAIPFVIRGGNLWE